jgi:N-acetylglucosamine-6-phosphate deacetylase
VHACMIVKFRGGNNLLEPDISVIRYNLMKTIDIHVHGIGGYDTRTTVEDHILKIAEMHGSYGVSEILLTIYPATIKLMRENMAIVRGAMKQQDGGQQQASEEKKPARIVGINLEGPFLNPSKCGALNAMTFLEPTGHNVEELIEGYEDIIKVITVAPEINGAQELIKNLTGRGIIVSMGHSDATYEEAEAGFHAGAKGITHIFNGMRGFHHREPGIAGFGLMNQEVFIEVIADPYHLHEEILGLIFKTKDSEKIIIVSDAVRETKTIPEDYAVHNTYGKLLGGSLTIAESAKRLLDMGYDEEIVLNCISRNPGKYLAGA